MFQTALISVIVPAFNAAPFIRDTLNSVLSQTYGNLEVIVVDDGSEDETVTIVESICRNDARVRLLQQQNQGAAAARNLGIENSRGEFIAPIDADDLWHPQKIEKQVACMIQSGPSVGLVYSWWISIDENGAPLYTSPKWRIEGMVFKTLLALNFIGNTSVPLIRRDCIQRVGWYNSHWRNEGGQGCEDWDFSLRIAEHYDFGLVPEYLVGYRSVKGSMALNFATMRKSHELMLRSVRQTHPEIPEKTYRWSRSNFYLYLSGVSFKNRQYKQAFTWILKAFFSEGASPFSSWTLKVILITLPKIALNFIPSFTGRTESNLHIFRQAQFNRGNSERTCFTEPR